MWIYKSQKISEKIQKIWVEIVASKKLFHNVEKTVVISNKKLEVWVKTGYVNKISLIITWEAQLITGET